MFAESLAGLFARPHAGTPGPTDPFWYGPPGHGTPAGVNVTTESAMRVATVFACIQVLADSVAMLPTLVYRYGDVNKRATDQGLYDVLHRQPNAWQTPFEFKQMMMWHLLLRGNWYCRILPGPRGAVDQLVPLHPDRVFPEQLPNGRMRYKHKPRAGEEKTYVQDEIFHVRGFSIDGVIGCTPLEFARNTIGLTIAQQTHGAALFKNGLPAFVLEHPATMGAEGIKNFRKDWRGVHAGPENAYNPAILEENMKLHELGLKNSDAQWLESRKFDAVEICRFFRMQPHMVQILDNATFSNIEHQGMEFVVHTLGPWLVRIEEAADRDLVVDPTNYYVEFLADALLRGDTLTRYKAYQVGILTGFLTRNEARRKENNSPLPGGDVPLEPMNMARAGSSGRQPVGDKETDDEAERADELLPSSEVNAADVFGPLIDDAASRIAAAELRTLEGRADKAAGDRDRFAAWATEAYQRHQDYTARTLAPLAEAWGRQTGIGVNPDLVAGELCQRALDELLAAADVPALLAQWRTSRVQSIATYLLGVFCHEAL